MTAVYLRAGVWLVVVAGVMCSVIQPRPDLSLQGLPPFLAARETQQRSFLTEQTTTWVLQAKNYLPSQLVTSFANPLFPARNSRAKIPQPTFPQLTVADLQRRGTVTFLMQHGPASYFLQGGEQMGFEYELAEEFARKLGIRVDIVIVPPETDAISWLHEGKGDIVAGVTTTDGMKLGAVITSRPYFETTAQIITKSDESAPRTLNELAGQPVALRANSAYAYQLQVATQTLALPPIVSITTGEEGTREALDTVINGQTTATVLMDPLVRLAQVWYPGQLRTAWALLQPVRLVWAVRPGQTALLETINDCLERASRSGVKKVLTEKYFVSFSYLRDITRESEGSLSKKKRLSRYDEIIARHAEEAGFDWRLVAALIFEESRFDHTRVSGAGAYGLMQLMPFTAQLVRVKNTQDPQANIEAGVKYLSFLSRQFQDERPRDRLALILASYVMGLGHVEDAQRIARLQGYDPDCWTESMEQILPLLEDPKHHSKTLFGYAQGREAVRYANSILRRYDLYSRHVARDFPPAEVPTPPDSQAASAVAG